MKKHIVKTLGKKADDFLTYCNLNITDNHEKKYSNYKAFSIWLTPKDSN